MPKPPLTLNMFIGFPSYGGNGGISSECPAVREWCADLQRGSIPKLKQEGKLGRVSDVTVADTPITMVRNQFVVAARKCGAHVLLTVDSDMNPNMHIDEIWFQPFFDVAFNAIYEHWHKGPLVIGAPYCGPPSDKGGENIYVFQFENSGFHGEYTRLNLSQFTRAEASKMSGVSEVAALPTGLVMYDMRIFDLLEPSDMTKEQVLSEFEAGKLTKTEALAALEDGWFFYEWKDQYAAEKGSTEDVAATRNMAMMGITKLGYNPLRCAWDSWAGHYKPWCVGKPVSSPVEHVAANLRLAVERQNSMFEVERDFSHQWDFRNASIKSASPLPHDFPLEILDDIPPGRVQYFGTREIFGEQLACFLHMTDDRHLKGLRDLVVSRSQELGRKLRIIEIGSWLGDSAIALSPQAYCESLRCVDWWSGSISDQTRDFKDMVGCSDKLLKVFMWNVRNHEQITVTNLPSTQAAIEYDEDPVDIIFIDADHSYECAKADIKGWLPHIRPDGIMIGHDYRSPSFPGVDRAVQEVFGPLAQEYCQLPDGSFWLVHMDKFFALANGNGHNSQCSRSV